jgi:hypothetical protein
MSQTAMSTAALWMGQTVPREKPHEGWLQIQGVKSHRRTELVFSSWIGRGVK